MQKHLNILNNFQSYCLYIINLATQIIASVCINLIISDYENHEGVSTKLLYIPYVCIFIGFIVAVYKLANNKKNITRFTLFQTMWSANEYFLAAMIISITTAHLTNTEIKASLMVYIPYLMIYWVFMGTGLLIVIGEQIVIDSTGIPDKGTKAVYNAAIMFAIMITIALCITPSIIPYIS